MSKKTSNAIVSILSMKRPTFNDSKYLNSQNWLLVCVWVKCTLKGKKRNLKSWLLLPLPHPRNPLSLSFSLSSLKFTSIEFHQHKNAKNFKFHNVRYVMFDGEILNFAYIKMQILNKLKFSFNMSSNFLNYD